MIRLSRAALALGLALLPGLALAQSTPAYQSGTVKQGDLLKAFTNGLMGSVGGILGDPLTAKGVNPFAITDNNGNGICFYASTSSGAINPLCIGHDINNNPVFSVGGVNYNFVTTNNGNVQGPVSSAVGNLAFFNSTGGTLLQDKSWNDNGTRLTAPTGRTITLQGTGSFQVGGVLGPFILNDGAADTVSVQALPGALPSTDTTNLQLYPPSPGQKAFLNITKLANGANEERLILGENGSSYVLSQVLGGTGICHNLDFLDGQSAVPAFTLVCGSGGVPSLALGNGGALLAGTPSNGFQGIARLDGSLNLSLGEGANIAAIVTNKMLKIGAGGLVLSVSTPTVTAGQIGFGTTTAAVTSCGSLAGSLGCLTVNVGGTARNIPYY